MNAGKITCPAYTTEQKLLRRLDIRLVPVIVLLYFLAFLDRYAVFSDVLQKRCVQYHFANGAFVSALISVTP